MVSSENLKKGDKLRFFFCTGRGWTTDQGLTVAKASKLEKEGFLKCILNEEEKDDLGALKIIWRFREYEVI